jgi:hypothetical protein
VIAVGAWLSSRGLYAPLDRSWSIELALDVGVGHATAPIGTSFLLRLSSEEWSYTFVHDNKISKIRIVDVPFVADRDDHQLLAATPSLKDLGALIKKLEQRYDVRFQRRGAVVRTNLAGAEPIVLAWASTL